MLINNEIFLDIQDEVKILLGHPVYKKSKFKFGFTMNDRRQ